MLWAPVMLAPLAWIAVAIFIALWIGQAVWAWRSARATPRVASRWWMHPLALLGFFAFFGCVSPLPRALRHWVVEPFRIPASAMSPTLLTGDRLFALKLGAWARLERGAVIVFRPPHQRELPFIKRIVAVGGDDVALAPEGLIVNGMLLPTRPCPVPTLKLVEPGASPIEARCLVEEGGGSEYATAHLELTNQRRYGPVAVPAGHVFVLSDNRDNSYDSRHFGPVPIEDVIGRARVIWLSLPPGSGVALNRIGLEL